LEELEMANEEAVPEVLAAGGPTPTPYFIHARSSLAERRPRILKHGDSFGLFDPHGDVVADGERAEGLYHHDTRHLSKLHLLVRGHAPMLLSSTVALDNAAMKVDLTNPDIAAAGDDPGLAGDVLHFQRTRFLFEARLFERLSVRNFGVEALAVELELAFAADFADIFEARGCARASRGAMRSERLAADRLRLVYDGEDGERRVTRLAFAPAPRALEAERARFELRLDAGARTSLFVVVDCADREPPAGAGLGFFHALKRARRPLREVARRSAGVETSNAVTNEVLRRAMADLTMLVTDTPAGAYPYAGVPWFSTPFGRDGLITALLSLWVDPRLARGVLRYLAATRATHEDASADAEPGKILHETRAGELARLGVVPFRHYYGTIDATPLFVVLAGAYLARTGDLATIRELEPAIDEALAWIERDGDRDGDGLVEYGRRRDDGLVNQGWKDSDDSVFHADGALADGPIALVEVQGYAFAAFEAAAAIAAALGRPERALHRRGRAEAVRARVEATFWSEDLGTYGLALDGAKRLCAVRASNAGQLLFTGLPAPERARRTAELLLSPAFFSGFGIRTLAAGEARFNPMSYHNGSIWPHDNALIALGLARYGLKRPALELFDGLMEAAGFMELRRLPELFCGFRRRPATGPTLYPVACSPQAWAAAAPFALLAAVLGLGFDAGRRVVRFDRPRLPPSLDEVTLRQLGFDGARADVRLRRVGAEVAVDVQHRRGDVEVEVTL